MPMPCMERNVPVVWALHPCAFALIGPRGDSLSRPLSRPHDPTIRTTYRNFYPSTGVRLTVFSQ